MINNTWDIGVDKMLNRSMASNWIDWVVTVSQMSISYEHDSTEIVFY